MNTGPNTGKNRKKVLIVGRMPEAGIAVLKARDDVDYEILTDDRVPSLHPKLADANAVTLGATPFRQAELDAAPNMMVVARLGVGFDAVEIHGAHGYLIDQFFWEGANKRGDAWGGDFVERTRFAAEIVKAIRARVGAGYPIIFRFSQWKQQDFTARLAPTPGELERFLEPLTDAGTDIFHCSTRRFWEPEFEGSPLNLAGWTKKLTGRPTITVGSVGLKGADFVQTFRTREDSEIGDLGELEARLEREEFDLVAVGRALLADPHWAAKVREGRFSDLAPFSASSLATLS